MKKSGCSLSTWNRELEDRILSADQSEGCLIAYKSISGVQLCHQQGNVIYSPLAVNGFVEDSENDVVVEGTVAVDCVERWPSKEPENFQIVPSTKDDICMWSGKRSTCLDCSYRGCCRVRLVDVRV